MVQQVVVVLAGGTPWYAGGLLKCFMRMPWAVYGMLCYTALILLQRCAGTESVTVHKPFLYRLQSAAFFKRHRAMMP
jgi:hypothetical protein